MDDGCSGDVRLALKIVPVAWTNECAEAYQLQKWGCDTWVRARLIRGRWKHFRAFQNFEAKALIEKALREWLNERNAYVVPCESAGTLNGNWVAYRVDTKTQDHLALTYPTAGHLNALAAAVLATKEGESAVDVYDASSGEYEGTVSLPRGQKPEGES